MIKSYLVFGAVTCLGFAIAAIAGWKAPNLGILDGMSSSGGGSGYRSGYHSGWRGGK